MADEVTGESVGSEEQASAPLEGAAAVDAAWDAAFPESNTGSFEGLVGEPTVETKESTEAAAEETEVKAEGEKTAEEPDATAQAAASESTIDPSLVSLAVELGADKAAVDELIARDPAEADKLLTELANEYNAKTSRILFGTPTPSTEGDPKFLDATGTSKETSEEETLSPLEKLFADEEKVAKFKEEHGELLHEVLTAQLAHSKAEKAGLKDLHDLREVLIAQQQQALTHELDTTFQSFGAPYAEFYGDKPFSELTDVQVEHRGQVGDLADKIRASDVRLGNEMKTERQYLIMAHHHVAAEIRNEASRKHIIEQLQTRAKSHTNRPSAHRVTNSSSGSPEEKALSALDLRIAELGVEKLFPD